MKWLIRLFLRMYLIKLNNDIYDAKRKHRNIFVTIGDTHDDFMKIKRAENKAVCVIEQKIRDVNAVIEHTKTNPCN